MGHDYRYFNRRDSYDPRNHTRGTVVDKVTAPATGRVTYRINFRDGGHAAANEHNLLALRSTNPALDYLADNWDSHDSWGTGMMALGAVCDVLYAMGEADRIDPGAGFRPATGQDFTLAQLADPDFADEWNIDYDTNVLATAVEDGEVSVDDLERASRILHLYLELARAAGRDY